MKRIFFTFLFFTLLANFFSQVVNKTQNNKKLITTSEVNTSPKKDTLNQTQYHLMLKSYKQTTINDSILIIDNRKKNPNTTFKNIPQN